MLPSEELLQSIDIIAQNAAKNGVKIYTAIVTAIADNNTCSVRANGKTHGGITYYGETPTVNKSYRIFCPNGSMNQAFIITGGGSLPIASADTLGGIKVGAGLTISSEGTLSATGGGTADAVEWSNVLDKPSTISGYGITDARISGNTITLGAQTMTPYTANNTPPYPVTSVNGQTGDITIATGGNVDSVNGKTGAVVLNASDVGALPSTTVIPDKTSQLDNDSGYITNSALTDYAKKTEIPTKTSELTNDSGYITNTALEPYAKTADVPTKTSQLNNDSGFITDSALTGYAKTTDIPTKTSQLENDSHYITASEAPVQSVNTKTGVVVLTQDDVGDGKTYVRTHNDFTDAFKTQINTNEDNIAMAESDIEGLQTDVGTLKTNVTNLQTALTSKQDAIVGAASTITEDNLATDRALISNSSGKVAVSNVTSTELGYLDGVTSNVQTQLDKKLEKAPVTSVNSKTGAVQLNASDVGALPDTTVIPSKTSELDNDSGYITNAALDGYAKDTDIPTKVSQLENDSKYITSAGAPVQSVNGQTGVVVIDIPEPYELPIASTTQLGGVKVGAGLSVTENGVLSATGGGTADAVEWNNVLDKPTTITGYGITDAKIDNGTITLGDKTITPLTSAPVTSVNSKTGDVELTADDVGALSKPATMTANKWFKTDANGAVALSDLPNASTGSKGITYLVDAYNRTDTDKAVTPKALNDVYKLIPEVTETLGTSTTKVPSEKAVSDALSSFGTGDMLKSTYDPTGSVATAGGIPNYVEANGGKIDTIKVNGTAQTITDKTVDISVPTKTSDLTNDSGYLTSAPVTSVNSKTGAVLLTADDVSAIPSTLTGTAGQVLTKTSDGQEWTDAPVTSVNGKTGAITIAKGDVGLGNVDNVKQYSASNPPPYPVKSVNNMTGDVETTFIFELNITDSGTEGEPLCQSSIDVSTIIQAYQENKQVIGQSVYTSYLGQFELLSCPSYAGDGNEMVFIGALSNIEIGLEGQVYTIKYTPTMDGDYVHANATPFKVDIPDNLVKYQSLSTIQATTKVNADTLQGHAADYFATNAGLTASNTKITNLTTDVNRIDNDITDILEQLDGKVNTSGGTMTGALVAQSNTNYTTRQVRNIIISTDDPSGGQSGDIWIRYTE